MRICGDWQCVHVIWRWRWGEDSWNHQVSLSSSFFPEQKTKPARLDPLPTQPAAEKTPATLAPISLDSAWKQPSVSSEDTEKRQPVSLDDAWKQPAFSLDDAWKKPAASLEDAWKGKESKEGRSINDGLVTVISSPIPDHLSIMCGYYYFRSCSSLSSLQKLQAAWHFLLTGMWVIDDLRKSRGLRSVRAFEHGPVHACGCSTE